MVEAPKEQKAGVPAYMATFADLMTLLLVFFILLNVYSREKQYGLLTAATGSLAEAFVDTLGLGGLLSGSKTIEERAAPEHRYAHRDDEGPLDPSRRGDEIELKDSKLDAPRAMEESTIEAPFVFAHGSTSVPPEGLRWLEQIARDFSRGRFAVVVEARAAFIETMTPMELACTRGSVLLDWLRKLGVRSELEIRARVLVGRDRGSDGAVHRGVAIRIIRRA
ncbi:MAG TPA: flagellar motor protein MotB [Planctomycetota bacterium]|nr:flagellar motor protein MotB [Planctomycetota bacterium]